MNRRSFLTGFLGALGVAWTPIEWTTGYLWDDYEDFGPHVKEDLDDIITNVDPSETPMLRLDPSHFIPSNYFGTTAMVGTMPKPVRYGRIRPDGTL